MRTLAFLLLLLAGACTQVANESAIPGNAPVAVRQSQPVSTAAPQGDLLACYGVEDSGPLIQLVLVKPDSVRLVNSRRLPWPLGVSKGGQNQQEPRVEAAVSATGLMLSVSWTDAECPRVSRTILTLPGLETLDGPTITSWECVTASLGCRSGWLQGGKTWIKEDEVRLAHMTIDLLPNQPAGPRQYALWRMWSPGLGYRYHTKEIDAFCRDDRHVWAIDDVQSPKYAIRFRELLSGKFSEPEEFNLPALANERYSMAACHKDTLVAGSCWSTEGSQGNRLRVLAPQGHTLREVHAWSELIPRVRDHGQRDLDIGNARPLAGNEVTDWHDLRVVGTTAVVAAGSRGLLIFDLADVSSAPQLMALRGDVTDIHQVGGRTFVLLLNHSGTTLGEFCIETDGSFSVRHLMDLHRATQFVD